jgi:ABC-type transport system involved in multi-copper enzyme maturation permease subunit
VLLKELRGRMRGARAFIVLTAYLLLLSCFTTIIYYAYSSSTRMPGGGPEMAYMGKVVFAGVVLIEIFMVAFVTPAFTAGAISGERERQTYELLRATLLPARRLVVGKLASALSYMLLLILAAIPLQSLAFMLGGVTLEELGLALLLLLLTVFAFGALGILFSSLTRKTLVSTVLTYVTTLLAMVGFPVLLVLSVALFDAFIYGYGVGAATPTPSWVVEVIALYALYVGAGLSPLSTAVLTEVILEEQGTIWFFEQSVAAGHDVWLPSPWIVYVVVYLALGLLALLLAVLRVRRQARK